MPPSLGACPDAFALGVQSGRGSWAWLYIMSGEADFGVNGFEPVHPG